MLRGRRIAFDHGDVRVGVAFCDPDGILSSPLPALHRKNPALLKDIEKLVLEYEPVELFVGLPALLSGELGESAAKAKEFGALLHSHFSLPVTFVDERLTTTQSQSLLREAGHNARQSKDLIDSMSAVAILNQGLALAR